MVYVCLVIEILYDMTFLMHGFLEDNGILSTLSLCEIVPDQTK